jgi:hypothetical protein
MDTFALYLQQFCEINLAKSNSRPYKPTDILADFHLLKYLSSNDILSFTMVRDSLNVKYYFYVLNNRNSLGSTQSITRCIT